MIDKHHIEKLKICTMKPLLPDGWEKWAYDMVEDFYDITAFDDHDYILILPERISERFQDALEGEIGFEEELEEFCLKLDELTKKGVLIDIMH